MVDGVSTTAVLAVTVVSSIVMTFALVLRFAVRYAQNDHWALHDYAFCIAFLLAWSCAGSNLAVVVVSQGQELANGDDVSIVSSLDGYLLASQMCWVFGATSAKLAVLLFYRRLFIHSWVQNATYILSGLLGALCLSGIAFLAINRGHSLSGNAGIGVVNSLLGVAILLLPPAVISTLNMSIHQKLIKLFWYSLGWIALAFSIVRLTSFDVRDASLSQQPHWPLILCCSVLEPTLWLIAGSIPTIRRTWRKKERAAQDLQDLVRGSRAQAAGDGVTALRENCSLTALPQIPEAVMINPRRNTEQLRLDTLHCGRETEVPASQGGTIRGPSIMTRESSTRTDRGLYTHWRHDEDEYEDEGPV